MEVSFKECLITLMNICSLLKFQGRPLVRKQHVKVAFPKEKKLPLLKEVLSKGGLVKPACVPDSYLTLVYLVVNLSYTHHGHSKLIFVVIQQCFESGQ